MPYEIIMVIIHLCTRDTFLVFNDRDDAELFLYFTDSLHKNIKITIELEENNCLPFQRKIIVYHFLMCLSLGMMRAISHLLCTGRRPSLAYT